MRVSLLATKRRSDEATKGVEREEVGGLEG